MKKHLLFKFLTTFLREYIFIFLTATIFLFLMSFKSAAEDNVFVIDNVEVLGNVDLNFSREKYINKGISSSFGMLMEKILLSKDLNKVEKIKLEDIKKLIGSFQILEEKYNKNEYKINLKILYSDFKVKKFLGRKNISFSIPSNTVVLFYPMLFINDEFKNFNENFFYNRWTEVLVQNEAIKFILPLEDLEDISQIIKMKNKIEDLDITNLVNKYNVKDYTFALIDYNNKKLNIYVKTNFNNKNTSKNFLYNVADLKDESLQSYVLKDLKVKINDIWKEENLINLLMPLSIKLKFEHKNLKNLDEVKKVFSQIGIVDNYILEEININNSYFTIYYYGDPKKLRSELTKFGYRLDNNQGYWELYLNE